MITEMTEIYKWAFMYLGANQNAFKVGRNLGIKNTAGYCPTGRGCANIFNTISCQVSRCISGDVTVEDFNPDLLSAKVVELLDGRSELITDLKYNGEEMLKDYGDTGSKGFTYMLS